MAPKLARMAQDDDSATAPVSSTSAASTTVRGDLDPLILALTRAVNRQAPDRTARPDISGRG